jgi:hypothetical protein
MRLDINNHVTIMVALNAARRQYMENWAEAHRLGMPYLMEHWAKDIEQLNDAQAELKAKQWGTN